MTPAEEIRFIAREHEFATSTEIALALLASRQLVAAVLGRSISDRDHAEHTRRGREIDWLQVDIMRKRIAERRQRLAA
jgi:hypothetical protein